VGLHLRTISERLFVSISNLETLESVTRGTLLLVIIVLGNNKYSSKKAVFKEIGHNPFYGIM